MKRPRFLLPGLAAVAVGAFGASSAMAAPTPPDLAIAPILDVNGNPTVVVDTVSQPPKTLLRFSIAIRNEVGAGPFEVQATDPAGAAGQVIYDGVTPGAPISVAPDAFLNLTPAPFFPNNPGNWILNGLSSFVLTPQGAPARMSPLTGLCDYDSGPATGTPGLLYPPPGSCTSPTQAATGVKIGITPGSFDTYDAGNTSETSPNYWDVTGVAPGVATWVASINANGKIQEGGLGAGNNSFTTQVPIPGVTAANFTAGQATAGTALTIPLVPHVTIASPDVPGIKAGGGTTAAGTLSFTQVTAPAHGTVRYDASGNAIYTASAGFSGTDSFAFRATDERGLSSAATVTVPVAAGAGGGGGTNPGGGGGTNPGGGGTKPGKGKVGPRLTVVVKFTGGRLVITFRPKAAGTARIVAKFGKKTVASCKVKAVRNKRATCKLRIANRYHGKKLRISATLTPKGARAAKASVRSFKVPKQVAKARARH
jgi:Big-like domain-containing protein